MNLYPKSEIMFDYIVVLTSFTFYGRGQTFIKYLFIKIIIRLLQKTHNFWYRRS